MGEDANELVGMVSSLYRAAAEPERWPEFLAMFTKQMNCDVSGLIVNDEQLTNCSLTHSIGLPSEAHEEYDTYYGAINPSIPPLFAQVRKSGAWHGLLRPLTGEAEYQQSEYYNEFGRKYGLYWGVVGTVLHGRGNFTTLNAAWSEERPAPGKSEVKVIGAMMPHFESALAIHHTMESSRMRAAAALGAVDALEGAIVAVDGAGQIILTNNLAEKMLRQVDGICARREHLATHNPSETRELEALIQSAVSTGAGRAVHAGGTMLIHRNALRPLRVTVVPFQSDALFAGTAPCALILINDPDARTGTRASVLGTLYQLTPSECRLADQLLQNVDLGKACEAIGITRGTARFMLKNIFRKTHTKSQAELIRFLLGLPNVHSVS